MIQTIVTPIPWRKPSSACHGVRKVDVANLVCLSTASYLKTAKMVVDVTLLGAQHKGKFTSTGGPSESPILCLSGIFLLTATLIFQSELAL